MQCLRWDMATRLAFTKPLLRGHDAVLGTRAARAFVSAPPVFLTLAGLTMAQAGQVDEARRILDQLRPALPRQPRDGRWIRIVATTGHLAALLDDAATVAWCLEQITPYGGYYLAAGSGSVFCEGAVARTIGTLAAALGRTDDARRWLAAGIAMDERIGALPYRVLSEIELAGLLAGCPGEREAAIGLAHRAADALYRAKTSMRRLRPAGSASSRPGEDHAVAAHLLYLTLTRILSWLALLCRRRSTLIAETLTLRHEVTVPRWQLGPTHPSWSDRALLSCACREPRHRL